MSKTFTASDFTEKVAATHHSIKCPIAPDRTEHTFNIGSAGEEGPWKIILNYEVSYEHRIFSCPHCILPHIHVHTRSGGSTYDMLAWVVPRAVTGYLDEYGDETTVTCLDCILEAVDKLGLKNA